MKLGSRFTLWVRNSLSTKSNPPIGDPFPSLPPVDDLEVSSWPVSTYYLLVFTMRTIGETTHTEMNCQITIGQNYIIWVPIPIWQLGNAKKIKMYYYWVQALKFSICPLLQTQCKFHCCIQKYLKAQISNRAWLLNRLFFLFLDIYNDQG